MTFAAFLRDLAGPQQPLPPLTDEEADRLLDGAVEAAGGLFLTIKQLLADRERLRKAVLEYSEAVTAYHVSVWEIMPKDGTLVPSSVVRKTADKLANLNKALGIDLNP